MLVRGHDGAHHSGGREWPIVLEADRPFDVAPKAETFKVNGWSIAVQKGDTRDMVGAAVIEMLGMPGEDFIQDDGGRSRELRSELAASLAREQVLEARLREAVGLITDFDRVGIRAALWLDRESDA